MKKMIFCTLLILCPLALFAQELKGEKGNYYSTITKSFPADEGGSFTVKDVTGDFEIRTSTAKKVEIEQKITIRSFTKGEAEEIFRRAKDAINKKGNVVRIEGDYDGDRVRNTFTVTVPEKFNVDIETKNGDIELYDVIGEINCRTSGGDVKLENTAGTTNVSTSGGDLQFVNASGPIKGSTSGGDIDLKDILGSSTFSTSGGDITLNGSKNDIRLNTSGGDISADNSESDLSANTSGGDISISDCYGKCSVNTSGGDIELENLKGEVSANTSGGDISGESFDEHISANTSGGDIKLLNVRAGINAKTSGGDVKVEITLDDFSKKHPIDLRTSGGSIELVLPEKLPASIDARIKTNRRNWQMERFDIYSDFPLTKTEPDDFGEFVIQSRGDINGGGDPVNLETVGGDIHIKKAK